MRKIIKINKILATALVAALATSIVTTMQFTNNPLMTALSHLIHGTGDGSSSNAG